MGRGHQKTEGYTKFHPELVGMTAMPASKIRDLIGWRQKFFVAGLIGADSKGVGFGNISMRSEPGSKEFIISGTKTGNFQILTKEHFVVVTDFDYQKNSVSYKRMVKTETEPSSESMTHAACYESDKKIQAVVHVHHKGLWSSLLHKVPTTAEGVEYGTPEMAMQIFRLFEKYPVWDTKIIAMAGHEGGILSFGRTLEEAGNAMMSKFEGYESALNRPH